MNATTKNQIEELIKSDNGALAEEMEGITSREEFIKVFADHGVQVSEEDADEFLQLGRPTNEDGELDDNALEEVSGGLALWAVIAAWKGGAVIGKMIRRGYDYLKYGDANRTYTVKSVVKSMISFGKAF